MFWNLLLDFLQFLVHLVCPLCLEYEPAQMEGLEELSPFSAQLKSKCKPQVLKTRSIKNDLNKYFHLV